MIKHPKIAALAVLPLDNRLLLVRRKNEPDADLWGFPGGHVDLGETCLDAAVRELHEETTIVATPVDYLTNIDLIIKDNNECISHHFLLASVLCEYRSGEPVAQDDVSDANWFDFEVVLKSKLPMSKNVDTVLRALMRRITLGQGRG